MGQRWALKENHLHVFHDQQFLILFPLFQLFIEAAQNTPAASDDKKDEPSDFFESHSGTNLSGMVDQEAASDDTSSTGVSQASKFSVSLRQGSTVVTKHHFTFSIWGTHACVLPTSYIFIKYFI